MFFFLFLFLLSLLYKLYHVLCIVWFLSVVVSAVQQYTCTTLLSCVEYSLWLARLPIMVVSGFRQERNPFRCCTLWGKHHRGQRKMVRFRRIPCRKRTFFANFTLKEKVPQVQYKKERKKDNSDKTWNDKSLECVQSDDIVLLNLMEFLVLTDHVSV